MLKNFLGKTTLRSGHFDVKIVVMKRDLLKYPLARVELVWGKRLKLCNKICLFLVSVKIACVKSALEI